MEIFDNGQWLPLVFAALMALAVLVYAILDGYDLGVGILMRYAEPKEQDTMIASIGPFWDANETWLVLAVGLLLIAFPLANGIVLGELYLPVAVMLLGLIIRGVSFDFRAKVDSGAKEKWNRAFCGGSLLTAMAQGYMVGSYVMGFQHGVVPFIFNMLVSVAVAMAFGLIGASWLIMKTDGVLQRKAAFWARTCLKGTVAGIMLVAMASPIVSQHVYDRWFAFPDQLILLPVPVLILFFAWQIDRSLRSMIAGEIKAVWRPFAYSCGVFLMCLIGLAYSFYPYIIPGQLKIVDAASAPDSLMFILVGALIVLPVMIGYTIFTYRVFHGKTQDLSYN